MLLRSGPGVLLRLVLGRGADDDLAGIGGGAGVADLFLSLPWGRRLRLESSLGRRLRSSLLGRLLRSSLLGRLLLRYEGETVGDMSMHFLHEGTPRPTRKAA